MASNQQVHTVSQVILTIFLVSSIMVIISLLVIILSSLLARNAASDREKRSPFECGFDPKDSARLPFSLRFFLIAIIFLIFDVEIVLLIIIPLIISTAETQTVLILGTIFFLILLFGLYFEWRQGALEWADWDYSQLWHMICILKVLKKANLNN